MMHHPNILLILTDQLRADALGCYGGRFVPTPHLDRLAAEGIRYRNAYTDCPVCTPARASLWTGKSILGHGVYGLHDVLPSSEHLFSEGLQSTGYTTALFGKLHVSARLVDANTYHPHSGFDTYENALSPYNHDCHFHAYRDWLAIHHPFVYHRITTQGTACGYIPEEAHFSTWLTSRSEAFIANQAGSGPFFCCASFVDPHDPFDDHPEDFLDSVDEEAIQCFDALPIGYRVPDGVQREMGGGVLGCAADYSPAQLTRMRRSYFASVALLDKCVGRLIGALERQGILDNTLVIFTSDHGEMLGQRGLIGKGAYFYEPCARIPLIARGPGFSSSNGPSERLVQLRDLAATILTAAGINHAQIRESMPTALALQSEQERDCAVTLYRNSCINRDKVFWDPPILCSMIRQGPLKLTVYHSSDPHTEMQGELFDLSRDPSESHTLWDDPAHQVDKARLLGKLTDWIVKEDYLHNGQGRGGRQFPPRKHWLKNNPIRLD